MDQCSADGSVFDADEVADAEVRILFTLADLDELWVAPALSMALTNDHSARAAPSGNRTRTYQGTLLREWQSDLLAFSVSPLWS